MVDGRARAFLAKAQEYLASAEDNLELVRHTVAAGNAIHAGICAKDAIVTVLAGQVSKSRDHATAVKELRQVLGQREQASAADRALRELVAAKSDVEYGVMVVTPTTATALVRRARTLVDLAVEIVRLGR